MRYLRIRISGIVQGVGFRPYVYNLALRQGVSGSVTNTTEGVDIEVGGEGDQVFQFLKALREKAPPQAVIDGVEVSTLEPFEVSGFRILPSEAAPEKSVLISPDLATCSACLAELFDADDRRYRYPFTNCTNCGPRFTIIRDTPYDRSLTSMAAFRMCTDCQREYDDPSSRRFHAQPNACPVCGPRVWLCAPDGVELEVDDPIVEAASGLKEGAIVAVKGLGGFQLAVDATSDAAVTELRRRKKRYGKPLAVMVESLEDAARRCEVSADEARMLMSPAAPITLLRVREDSGLSSHIAYGLGHQGIFLPYTPLHHLLMREAARPLVMTSGNASDEPIAKGNEEALGRLEGIADRFLLHDREILVRYDDSVNRVFAGLHYPVRRARGYAPYPVAVRPVSDVEVLGVGAELKNTFCILRGERAFISQHIGDMETREHMEHFEEALEAMKRLFDLEPRLVAHDLHPDYMTTQMASEMPLTKVGVQHHHAHVAACAAENAFTGHVLGVAWDGTGYGPDGTVWGGEFLLCDGASFERLAKLRTYPMPGADACIYGLHRMAAGVLSVVTGDVDRALELVRGRFRVDEREAESIAAQLAGGVNAPLTSSAGRLFDTVAALSGVRVEARYDGQAASELEAAALPVDDYYEFSVSTSGEPWVIDTAPVIEQVIEDLDAGAEPGKVSGRFHATMAEVVVRTCVALRTETGLSDVALSGGVFQNELLTGWVVEGLEDAGFNVLLHRKVPCNDGGISLGQAMIAAAASR